MRCAIPTTRIFCQCLIPHSANAMAQIMPPPQALSHRLVEKESACEKCQGDGPKHLSQEAHKKKVAMAMSATNAAEVARGGASVAETASNFAYNIAARAKAQAAVAAVAPAQRAAATRAANAEFQLETEMSASKKVVKAPVKKAVPAASQKAAATKKAMPEAAQKAVAAITANAHAVSANIELPDGGILLTFLPEGYISGFDIPGYWAIGAVNTWGLNLGGTNGITIDNLSIDGSSPSIQLARVGDVSETFLYLDEENGQIFTRTVDEDDGQYSIVQTYLSGDGNYYVQIEAQVPDGTGYDVAHCRAGGGVLHLHAGPSSTSLVLGTTVDIYDGLYSLISRSSGSPTTIRSYMQAFDTGAYIVATTPQVYTAVDIDSSAGTAALYASKTQSSSTSSFGYVNVELNGDITLSSFDKTVSSNKDSFLVHDKDGIHAQVRTSAPSPVSVAQWFYSLTGFRYLASNPGGILTDFTAGAGTLHFGGTDGVGASSLDVAGAEIKLASKAIKLGASYASLDTAYAEFYTDVSGQNPAAIVAGAAVNFPLGGAAGVTYNVSTKSFTLLKKGVYDISWHVATTLVNAVQTSIFLDSGSINGNTTVGALVFTSSPGYALSTGRALFTVDVDDTAISFRNSGSTSWSVLYAADGQPTVSRVVIRRVELTALAF
jgi:hypothetical protein